jgi:hypothetical protein
MFFDGPTTNYRLILKVLTIHPNDKKQTISWKRKDERSPNDFLANYAAKKNKTMTRQGSQQKIVVAPALRLINLHSKHA